MFHFGIIRTYTGAILNVFNELEVQYRDSNNTTRTKNVPIQFSSKEKAHIFDSKTTEQLLSGNYNVLPRAALSLSTMVKDSARVTNKLNKINTYKDETHFEFQYNAIPYNFTYELSVQCRGMNEATTIVEQVLPMFNPVYNIDIYEVPNLSEPSRIPLYLLDVSIESEDYDELSQNIVTVNFGLELRGNIYPPIKSIERIKEFKMQLNEYVNNDNEYIKKSILGWDVNEEGTLENESHVIPEEYDSLPPEIIDIIGLGVSIGSNELEVLYSDKDNLITELEFEWSILNDTGTNAVITAGNPGKAILELESAGSVEVQVKITDYHGNFNSLSKEFTVL